MFFVYICLHTFLLKHYKTLTTEDARGRKTHEEKIIRQQRRSGLRKTEDLMLSTTSVTKLFHMTHNHPSL